MSPLADLIGTERYGRLAAKVRALRGAGGAIATMDRARSRRIERSGTAADRAKSRWKSSPPDANLTWGFELTGSAFVEAARRHGAFGDARTVLEIGSGYGRLLRAAIESGAPFERWMALDISEQVVDYLVENFDDPRVEAVHGDVESAVVDRPIDTVLSSLTFKHLYPDFGGALTHLRRHLAADAVVVFDLIEGADHRFQTDGKTFVRAYDRGEIDQILRGCGFRRHAFDEVAHDAEHVRLLVVATPS